MRLLQSGQEEADTGQGVAFEGGGEASSGLTAWGTLDWLGGGCLGDQHCQWRSFSFSLAREGIRGGYLAYTLPAVSNQHPLVAFNPDDSCGGERYHRC